MLSQAVGYAASALGCLRPMGGKPALVKELADACGIPPAFLAKIVNVLARNQLVLTQRGVGGGVSLARSPQETTLLDLCEALDDPVVQPRCMLGHAECTEDRACPAHQFCTTHREGLVQFLSRTTIADIAAFETRRRWRAARSESPNLSDQSASEVPG